MVIIAAVLGVGAVAVTLRWWTRRYDGLGRVRRFPAVSVGLLAVMALVALVPPYLRHNEESRLASAASQLVGTKVAVHCQSFGQTFVQLGAELGFVKYGPGGVPEHQTYLKHGPCGELRSYLSSDKQQPSPDQIVAVHVLTHESMHMRGITNEAQAECAAVQRDATTAELLGASVSEAEALARVYWVIDYPRMPTDYRSPDCTPGGSYDEHLADPPWGR
jgi:hypothetical protein